MIQREQMNRKDVKDIIGETVLKRLCASIGVDYEELVIREEVNQLWMDWLVELITKNVVVIFGGSNNEARQLKDIMTAFGVLDHTGAGDNQAVAKAFKEFILGLHNTDTLLELGREYRRQMARAGNKT